MFFRSTLIVILLLGIGLCVSIPPAAAQAVNFDPEKGVPVDFFTAADGVPQGGSLELAIRFKVLKDFHITSLETGLFYVEFDTIPGLTFSMAQFPQGRDYKGNIVFGGDVIVRSTVTAASDVTPGAYTLKANIGYQVCIETGAEQCFLPVDKSLTQTINVLASGQKAEPKNQDIFQKQVPADKAAITPPSEPSSSSGGFAGSVENALKRGSWLALFLVFIGGILSSFTPCVYPIIPITISYIGGRAEGKRMRGFVLSLFFVLGLALMYSSLGVIAALSGGVFGGLTQHPAVYVVLIAIFLVMGASMMGAFDLQLPASWQGKLQSGKRKGAGGAIAMGMVSGLIAAPCVGPILVALLTWVAKSGSILVGFGMLFTYSLGMGVLFIVIGTFAGAMASLPKAGGWMDGVKHFFGWLLWGTAVYFAGVMLPTRWDLLIWGAFLSLLGIYVGAFRPSTEEYEWRWMLKKWVGILAVTTGVFLFIFGLAQIFGLQTPAARGETAATTEATPQWVINDPDGAFAKAAAENRPLMMDFYADWCIACVELDHKTYNRTEVLNRAEKFVCLKMDFTRQNNWSRQMTEKYGVKGMPTVIFFTPQGQELERFVGFKEFSEVAKIMDNTLAASK
ncbi:MAG: protein-disulfide reductase DsbD [bacterium]|nr:protein-disulfide reductase DsbD [bacterium]